MSPLRRDAPVLAKLTRYDSRPRPGGPRPRARANFSIAPYMGGDVNAARVRGACCRPGAGR